MTNKDKSDKRGELAGQEELGGRGPWKRGPPQGSRGDLRRKKKGTKEGWIQRDREKNETGKKVAAVKALL